jgi:hypothetical protein
MTGYRARTRMVDRASSDIDAQSLQCHHRQPVIMIDHMKWVHMVMAFLAASNFVVSSIRTVLLLVDE